MYRSDIRVVLYKNGYEKLLHFYNENGYDKSFISESNVREETNGRVIIELNYVPSPNKDIGIKNLVSGLYFLKDNNFSYHYIRLGEREEDTRDFMFTAKGEQPLYMNYPEFTMEEGD